MWAKNDLVLQAKRAVNKTFQPPDIQKEKQSNKVLWMQILICVALLGLAVAVKYFNLPAYDYFENCYKKSLQNSAALQEQQFVRFAMGILEGVYNSAGDALEVLAPRNGEEQNAEKNTEQGKPLRYEMKSAAQKPVLELSNSYLRFHTKSKKAAPEGCSLQSWAPMQESGSPLADLFITSEYGWRKNPLTGKSDFHTGVDLAAEEGTTIYAVYPGYVRMAYYGASYGNCLRLMNGEGTETLYAHLQYLFVAPGQHVEKGEVLGTVGRTGDATGPHLHFEVLRQGVRYNPDEVLGQ